MTFDDFLNQNNNKYVEAVDPTNPYQCFDLVVAWCIALGLPQNIFAGLLYAYQIFNPSTSLAANHFDYILNTTDAIPQKGDIIVWSKSFNGTAGHTAISTGKGDINTFECLEQNDPIGSNSHLKTYNYDCVIGWLRFKGNPVAGIQVDPTIYSNLVTKSTNWDAVSTILKIDALDAVGGDKAVNQIVDLQKQVLSFPAQLAGQLAEADAKCQQVLSTTKTDMMTECANEKGALQKAIDDLKKNGIMTPVETPLTERFRGKSLSEKLKAVIDIFAS